MASALARVALIAPTGMLGSGVFDALQKKYQLVLVFRDRGKLAKLDEVYGGVDQHQLVLLEFRSVFEAYIRGFPHDPMPAPLRELYANIGDVDAVINCAGVIKPYATNDPAFTLFLNSALPHLLSAHYAEKLIQITTDCAFNGLKGYPYDENAALSPQDLYGLSKILGEPKDRSLVLRTSIIGPEISGHVSLLDWFRSQKGKTVKGFAKHFWNGITAKQFGKICDQIVQHRQRYPQHGLFHIFSTTLSKYAMLQKFKEKYRVNCNIEKDETQFMNRTLTTIYQLNTNLRIPSFDAMVDEL